MKRSRKEYIKSWRRQKKLMEEFIDNLSDSDDDNEEPIVYLDQEREEGSFLFENELSLNSEISGDIIFSSSDESSDDEIVFPDALLDESNEEEANLSFSDEIALWVLRNKITRVASNELLEILRRFGHQEEFPKRIETLIKTPRKVSVQEQCGGQYVNLGLAVGLHRVIDSNPGKIPVNKMLKLLINIDGVPLFKSTGAQLWPILCQANEYPPFIVAIYHGMKKPNDPERFLSDFLSELKHLHENGFMYQDVAFSIDITAFVCDAPARQFIKMVKGHNGYYGCERCEVEGVSIQKRMVFHGADFEKRTSVKFNEYEYEDTHQTGYSPLIPFGINCVEDFSLDYMHLVCLGVVKRMIMFWKGGPFCCRLSSAHLSAISECLKGFSGTFPTDFNRQPCGLDEYKRWKATELRQFLLYSGCVALKGILKKDFYSHFLSLSLAMRIFLEENDDIRKAHLNYAKQLIRYFTSKSRELYSDIFCVYNVHSLNHLSDDVEWFNRSLNGVSSFPFENYLQVLKSFVRKSQNPIAQVVKRVSELDHFSIQGTQYKSNQSKLSSKRKDSFVLLHSQEFAQIIEVLQDGSFKCLLIPPAVCQNLFTDPCKSKIFNIVFVRQHEFQIGQVKKHHVFRKAVCLEYKDGIVLLPLLHDF